MNTNITLPEIEKDMQDLSKLRKEYIINASENFKRAEVIAKKVIEESNKVNKSIVENTEDIEVFGKVAETISDSYENGHFGALENIEY